MESFRTRDGRTLAYRRDGSGHVLVCRPGGPEAGHWIFFEQRERFSEVVTTFLADGARPA